MTFMNYIVRDFATELVMVGVIVLTAMTDGTLQEI
jgi:hypothetical protein